MSHNAGVRILKNTVILVVIEILSKVLGMVVIVVAARRLGVTNFGLLAFAAAFTEIFGVVVAFGFNTLIIREVARDETRAPRMMGDVIVMQGVFAAVSFSAMALALHLLGTEGIKLRLTYVVGLSTILNSCLLSLNAFFRARQSVEYEALIRFIFSAVRAVLVTAVLLMGYGVLPYAVAEFVTYVLCLTLCIYLLRRLVARPLFKINLQAWLDILRAALPFALMAGVVILYVRADTLILSLLKGDEVTGFYSAATKLLMLFTFVPTSVVGAVLPAMSKHAVQDKAAMIGSLARTFRFLFMLGLPIALGMGLLASQVVAFLYGTEFMLAVPSVQILMVAMVLSFLNFAVDAALISTNHEKALLGIAFLGVVFTMVVNVVLVLRLSYIGASITAALTEGLVLLLKIRVLQRTLGPLPLMQGLSKIVFGGLAMSAFLIAFQSVSMFVLVGPSAAIYVSALLLLRAIDAEEMEIARHAIPSGLRKFVQKATVKG